MAMIRICFCLITIMILSLQIVDGNSTIKSNDSNVLYCWICDSSIDYECLNKIPHGLPTNSISSNIRKYFQPCNWSVNIVNYQCLTIYPSLKDHKKQIIRKCGYDDYHFSCYQNQSELICPCDYNGCNGSTTIKSFSFFQIVFIFYIIYNIFFFL